MSTFPKIAQLKTPEQFRARLAELGLDLPCDERPLAAAEGSPLAAPLEVGGFRVGNRWCIQPMEGWDANPDGSPSRHTLRRWRNFGLSGAKLIWGGEAAAVVPEGRANPHQTLATPANRQGLAALLAELRQAHREAHGQADDLLVGLQLTHSGRFSRPTHQGPAPRIAYHHPLLDARVGLAPSDDTAVLSDRELDELVERYVAGAMLAREVGFQFVDLKACHGYLVHELLSARRRPGPFGGDLSGRSRLLLLAAKEIRRVAPDLLLGVRLSAFDFPPFENSPHGSRPVDLTGHVPYDYAFGANRDRPLQIDLAEPIALVRELQAAGISLVNLSAGSPYYNPHLLRPAAFPPSDGYPPPEDPLVGVARQIQVTWQCKQALGDFPLVGSGYSYLQDYLPHVAQAVVRAGWVDSVGIGRMVLSYPEAPADVLFRGTWQRRRVCRTFSECTTAPRNGLASGCYPLDPYYKALPEAERMKEIKCT